MLRQPMRPIAVFLCAILLLPALPLPSRAECRACAPVITLEVGQPAVWSLGQAHYLLAQMHKRNTGLATPVPSPDDLNPNRANGSRLEALRTFFGIEAQFDQGIGTQNQLALQRFRGDQARQENARAVLQQRQDQRRQLDREVTALDEEIARLEAQDKARGTKAPNAADLEREETIAVLKARRDDLKAERDRLDTEIGTLTTAANTSPNPPMLATSPVSSTATQLSASSTLTKFMDKFADESSTPSVAASTALDNFVDMQYEIISKQLTLLRDEVGPDERIVFLELPTSIYTVDKRADNYVGQVEWKVTKYYDQDPPMEIKREVIQRNLLKEGKSLQESNEILKTIQGLDPEAPKNTIRQELEMSNLPSSEVERIMGEIRSDNTPSRPYPVTLEMIIEAAKKGMHPTPVGEDLSLSPGETGLQNASVRALEIIPHQSALNVNENHATTNNFSILGVLKLISGFGAKVDYQRQKELYEKFLQQKAFASGFGKGSNEFGWTFGPLPGSKRIEPGQRTTYAVLAVPRNTLALELTATTKAFKRKDSPLAAAEKNVQSTSFLVLVPGEATERFWIDSIAYTPALKGKRVAAIIDGKYFSPQLGVLVNGVPLKRVISITRTGSDEPLGPGIGQGVEGEYEVANSREIILSFSMGGDFVGTPLITLVTPERSNAINSFKIEINHRPGFVSLKDYSLEEPMFMEGFNVTPKLEKLKGPQGFVLARLSGTGLRPGAEISINGVKIEASKPYSDPGPFFYQESTHSYLVSFKEDPAADSWKVRYQQKTTHGFEESEFTQRVGATFEAKLRHYRPGNPAEADLTFAIPEKLADPDRDLKIVLDDPDVPVASDRKGCAKPRKDEDGAFRVKCLIPPVSNRKAARDFITVKVATRTTGDKKDIKTRFVDIPLPVRPSIVSIKNLLTQKPSGFASLDTTVVIKGENLQHVTGVLFGDQEAQILAPSSDVDVLMVKVPKIEVPKGLESAVPVLLRTDAGLSMVGTYTYMGEPPPKVVVSRYPFYPSPEEQ